MSEGGVSAITTNGPPHGGVLVDLLVEPDRATDLSKRAAEWPSWRLTRRQRCDLELLGGGGFSPLRTFLGEADYLRVCESMRLAGGTLWPIPITLDLPDDLVTLSGPGSTLALRDTDDTLLAVLHITQAWRPDRAAEAAPGFGTTDPPPPGAEYLLRHVHPCDSPATPQ